MGCSLKSRSITSTRSHSFPKKNARVLSSHIHSHTIPFLAPCEICFPLESVTQLQITTAATISCPRWGHSHCHFYHPWLGMVTIPPMKMVMTGVGLHYWLVVGPPLWKIWKSIGMMTFPIYGKIKNVPNHQPVNDLVILCCFNLHLHGEVRGSAGWIFGQRSMPVSASQNPKRCRCSQKSSRYASKDPNFSDFNPRFLLKSHGF